jgi:transcriptional regulator with XRE-family HTH domain
VKIGKELKAMRENVGLSQGQVAKELGFTSPQLLSNVERSVSRPPISALKKMAKLYIVDLNYIKQLVYESSVAAYSENLKKRLGL